MKEENAEKQAMMEGYYNEEKIRIALQKEHDEILTENVTKSVTEKVTEKNLRRYVLAMKDNGLDAASIAKLLKEPFGTVSSIYGNDGNV